MLPHSVTLQAIASYNHCKLMSHQCAGSILHHRDFVRLTDAENLLFLPGNRNMYTSVALWLKNGGGGGQAGLIPLPRGP